jgi:hypothetical protein
MNHITKNKGDIAVAEVIRDLTRKGFSIFVPAICEHLPFDLIVYKDGKMLRIQVKYSADAHATANTIWSDKNGSHKRKYEPTDFDYYALYLPQIDRIIYPSISFRGVSFRTTVPNSATPFYWWEDFQELTDSATKKNYRDFGIELTHTVTDKVLMGRIKRRKVIRPSKEELEKLLWEKPVIHLAKDFGVSDKAIAKWAKSYAIIGPPMGHWSKKV